MIHNTLIVKVIKMLLKFIILYMFFSQQKLNNDVKRERENWAIEHVHN